MKERSFCKATLYVFNENSSRVFRLSRYAHGLELLLACLVMSISFSCSSIHASFLLIQVLTLMPLIRSEVEAVLCGLVSFTDWS